jgi:hypothetical protein
MRATHPVRRPGGLLLAMGLVLGIADLSRAADHIFSALVALAGVPPSGNRPARVSAPSRASAWACR